MSWFIPFQFPGDHPHATASVAMFDRGHIDHFALNVSDAEIFEELRRRLVKAGATDGTVTDFGITRNVWFEEPDGMGYEIAIWGGRQPLPFDERIEESYQPQPALGCRHTDEQAARPGHRRAFSRRQTQDLAFTRTQRA